MPVKSVNMWVIIIIIIIKVVSCNNNNNNKVGNWKVQESGLHYNNY